MLGLLSRGGNNSKKFKRAHDEMIIAKIILPGLTKTNQSEKAFS
jgi:hypothetical protein